MLEHREFLRRVASLAATYDGLMRGAERASFRLKDVTFCHNSPPSCWLSRKRWVTAGLPTSSRWFLTPWRYASPEKPFVLAGGTQVLVGADEQQRLTFSSSTTSRSQCWLERRQGDQGLYFRGDSDLDKNSYAKSSETKLRQQLA